MGIGLTREEYEIELIEQYSEGYFDALNSITDANLELRNKMMKKYEKNMKKFNK